MLGKLIKYEFRAIIKQFAIIWPAVLIIAVIVSLTASPISSSSDTDFYFILSLLYSSTMIGMSVLTMVFIINRFKKGLLGREGYLMFTLPVTTSELIVSKLLSSVITTVLSYIVGVVALALLTTAIGGFTIGEIIDSILNWSNNDYQSIFQMLLWLFVDLMEFILLIYVCVSLSHMIKKGSTVIAVVIFVLISSIVPSIESYILQTMELGFLSFDSVYSAVFNFDEYINGDAFSVSTIFSAAMVAIYYYVTKLILTKKLNLE